MWICNTDHSGDNAAVGNVISYAVIAMPFFLLSRLTGLSRTISLRAQLTTRVFLRFLQEHVVCLHFWSNKYV
jgi:hypothetical protein